MTKYQTSMTPGYYAQLIKADEEKRKHYVMINVRGCDTDRDCYCTVTNGVSHSENDFPWVLSNGTYERGGTEEIPLSIPMRKGEDTDDYRERLIKLDAWDECYDILTSIYSDWIHPDDIAPNSNPYRD